MHFHNCSWGSKALLIVSLSLSLQGLQPRSKQLIRGQGKPFQLVFLTSLRRLVQHGTLTTSTWGPHHGASFWSHRDRWSWKPSAPTEAFRPTAPVASECLAIDTLCTSGSCICAFDTVGLASSHTFSWRREEQE